MKPVRRPLRWIKRFKIKRLLKLSRENFITPEARLMRLRMRIGCDKIGPLRRVKFG